MREFAGEIAEKLPRGLRGRLRQSAWKWPAPPLLSDGKENRSSRGHNPVGRTAQAAEPFFSQPVRQVVLMLVVVMVVAAGLYLIAPVLLPVILHSPWLNGLIGVVFVIGVLGFAKNPALRLIALAVLAIPAVIAGYALVHGVTKHVIDSAIAINILGGIGGLVIGIAAVLNLNSVGTAALSR